MTCETSLMGMHIENNLPFRIESSRILSNFKLSQSFVLLELTKTRTHKFSTTAKELILAKYDTWFLFLMEVERILIMASNIDNIKKILLYIENKYIKFMRDDEKDFIHHLKLRDHVLAPDVKKLIKILALAKQRVYMNILRTNELFDQKFIDVCEKIHKYMLESIIAKIIDTPYEPTTYFKAVGEHLAEVLHHTLYEVYELDLIFDKSTNYIVLNCDQVAVNVYKTLNINVIARRLDIYLQEIDKLGYKIDSVHLKLYDDPNPAMLRETEDLVASYGLKLIKG